MKAESILENHHLKPTAMRILVLNHMQNIQAAISLTNLYEAFENSDRITLYRTLKSFEEHGLIHSIIDKKGNILYALCHAQCDLHEHRDTHIHFFCTLCENTYCLPKFTVPNIELPKGFKKASAKLLVDGKCDKCI